jgi:phosphoribosylaminoimidazole-succinocarboxamide synthase
MAALTETRIEGVPLLARGKVRDIYDLGDRLLLVATDRISAFDVVLPQPIPDKGKVLHQISRFWFEWFREVVPNHLVTDDVSEYPEPLPSHAAELRGRSAIVRKAKMFPVECVARGYITGSGWKEYQASGTVCGIALPAGLVHGDELPEPIFTPATKAESGHDENISYERMVEFVGADAAQKLRNLTLDLYSRAAEMAREKGIIIADTKFEFGVIDEEIAICDEMLTPDSSRFWPADEYEPGRAQPSFDKQYVRDFLETCTWDKTPPGPDLPAEVIEGTRARYVEALERISGRGLD